MGLGSYLLMLLGCPFSAIPSLIISRPSNTTLAHTAYGYYLFLNVRIGHYLSIFLSVPVRGQSPQMHPRYQPHGGVAAVS